MGICYNTDKFLERSKGDNMPTIEDVARAAGVSRSTVSLVLNKSPLVRETTKRRVEEAIAELNYVPNNNARGLSSRITNALAASVTADFSCQSAGSAVTVWEEDFDDGTDGWTLYILKVADF